ncbi:MAG: hypothetical protein EA376_05105 [Phycisphaeraceae bacterium]|nr:MAG: hypothetical protein EA376_05105 [Phycisphaeraceae bacterium]
MPNTRSVLSRLTILLLCACTAPTPILAADPETLVEQIRSNSLSDSAIEAAVQRALEMQRDRETPWDPAWGDVIDAADDAGHIDGEQLRQYARHSLNLELVTRPRIGRIDAPVASLEFKTRVGAGRMFGVQIDVLEARFGDRELLFSRRPNQWVISHREPDTPRFLRRMNLSFEHAPEMHPPGPVEIHLDIEIRIFENRNPEHGALLTVWRETLVANVEIVDAENDPIALVHDASERRHLEQNLFAQHIRVMPQPDGGCFLTMSLGCKSVLTAFAFDVFLQHEDNQWHVGEFAAHTDDQGLYTGLSAMLPADVLDLDEVDVLFLPSPEAARRDIDIIEIFGESIVIRRVPVQKPPWPVQRPQ